MVNRRNRNRQTRRNRRNMKGGSAYLLPLSPSELTDVSMSGPGAQSIAQGAQFAGNTRAMHGGMADLSSAYSAGLPDSLRASARMIGQDAALGAIGGMQDGGRRRRRRSSRKTRNGSRKASRKNRKGSRKSRKGSRKGRKGSRKSRKSRKNRNRNRNRNRRMRGGALGYSEVSAGGMLLTPEQTARAGLPGGWQNGGLSD